MGVVLLAGVGWGGLTLAAIRSTPPQTEASSIDFSGPTQWMQLKPAELSGIHYYRQANCAACHNVTGGEARTGPNLLNTGKRHDAAWMVAHFKAPQSTSPGSTMVPVNLSGAQLSDLAAAMLALTPDNGNIVDTETVPVNGNGMYTTPAGYALPGAGATGPIVAGVSSADCADNNNASATPGNKVQMWTCDGNAAAQNWTVASNGTLQIDGGCMDITGANYSNGTLIEWWTCNGGANQVWQAQNGELVNPHSGKCLDDPASNTTPGTQLILYTCNGGANQRWSLP